MLKATPITRKASSACKMNMDLIKGDREVQQKMTKKVGFSEAAEASGMAVSAADPKGPPIPPVAEEKKKDDTVIDDPALDSTNPDTAPPKGQAEGAINP
jgi:hypothetical protein